MSKFHCLRIATALLCVAAAEPSPIRMNQLGFLPDGPKRAIVADPSPTPLAWRLTDARGGTIASGKTERFGPDAASGESVHRIDLGGVARPGSGYRLIVGAKQSRPFRIHASLYQPLQYASLNYFYQS